MQWVNKGPLWNILVFTLVTGRFATLPVRHLDVSFRTFRRFDTRTFRYLSGRFATGRQRSSSVSQITNFQTAGKTSREVAKRPGIETFKGAKRPGGDHPGGEQYR